MSEMPDRADLDTLHEATDAAVKLAQSDLSSFFELAAREEWSPQQVREGLLELMPALVDRYGTVAATATAEWYEQIRNTEVGGNYTAVVAKTPSEAQIQGTVRAATRKVMSGDYQLAETVLNNALQRYIANMGRDTIVDNSIRDKKAKRFARVPRGKTCSWCLMLASRGWDYTSAEAAGKKRKFHDKCDCQIVPAFGDEIPKIKGYDHEALYEKYKAAREDAAKTVRGDPDDAAIAASMRKLFTDDVTDGKGVARPASNRNGGGGKPPTDKPVPTPNADDNRERRRKPIRVVSGKYVLAKKNEEDDERQLPFGPEDVKITDARWKHILDGEERRENGQAPGGHDYATVVEKKIEGKIAFPESWSRADIQDAVESVIQSPRSVFERGPARFDLNATVNGVDMVVQVAVKKSGPRVITAHPMRGEGVVRVHNGKLVPVP